MLHRNQRQLNPDELPNLPCPQARRIDYVLGLNDALGSRDQPGAALRPSQAEDATVAVDLGTLQARGFRVGMCCPRRVEVPFHWIVYGAVYFGGVHERTQLGDFRG